MNIQLFPKAVMHAISYVILTAFVFTSVVPPSYAQALPWMPEPGTQVSLSPAFTPAHLKGMMIDPNSPFKFDFIIDKGDEPLSSAQKQDEYQKLIKYFLAALAVPDKEQWVNLSPYEQDRIIPDSFGLTGMGRDLLAQDYLLKQVASSLTNPEEALGKKFWDKVYAQAHEKFGTTDIPASTINKVWIVPDKADMYEKGNAVLIVDSHLKVMLETDYLALQKEQGTGHMAQEGQAADTSEAQEISKQVLREVIIPAIEKEVNEGKNFVPLRQVVSGMILATWYKMRLKETVLGKVYADQSKVKGIDQDPKANQEIYTQYIAAFKKGVFNMIKEDVDQFSQEVIPRKYFSGGIHNSAMDVMKFKRDLPESAKEQRSRWETVEGQYQPGQFPRPEAAMKGWVQDVKEMFPSDRPRHFAVFLALKSLGSLLGLNENRGNDEEIKRLMSLEMPRWPDVVEAMFSFRGTKAESEKAGMRVMADVLAKNADAIKEKLQGSGGKKIKIQGITEDPLGSFFDEIFHDVVGAWLTGSEPKDVYQAIVDGFSQAESAMVQPGDDDHALRVAEKIQRRRAALRALLQKGYWVTKKNLKGRFNDQFGADINKALDMVAADLKEVVEGKGTRTQAWLALINAREYLQIIKQRMDLSEDMVIAFSKNAQAAAIRDGIEGRLKGLLSKYQQLPKTLLQQSNASTALREDVARGIELAEQSSEIDQQYSATVRISDYILPYFLTGRSWRDLKAQREEAVSAKLENFLLGKLGDPLVVALVMAQVAPRWGGFSYANHGEGIVWSILYEFQQKQRKGNNAGESAGAPVESVDMAVQAAVVKAVLDRSVALGRTWEQFGVDIYKLDLDRNMKDMVDVIRAAFLQAKDIAREAGKDAFFVAQGNGEEALREEFLKRITAAVANKLRPDLAEAIARLQPRVAVNRDGTPKSAALLAASFVAEFFEPLKVKDKADLLFQIKMPSKYQEAFPELNSESAMKQASTEQEDFRLSNPRFVEAVLLGGLRRDKDTRLVLSSLVNFIYDTYFGNAQEAKQKTLEQLKTLTDEQALQLLGANMALVNALMDGIMIITTVPTGDNEGVVKALRQVAIMKKGTPGFISNAHPRMSSLAQMAHMTWAGTPGYRGMARMDAKLNSILGGIWQLLPVSETEKDFTLLRGLAGFLADKIEEAAKEGYTDEERAGLVDRIEGLVSQFSDPADQKRLRKALKTAMFIHRNARREADQDGLRPPYFKHILDAVENKRHSKATDVMSYIKPVYHDIREDEPETYEALKNYVEKNIEMKKAVLEEGGLDEAETKALAVELERDIRRSDELKLNARILSNKFDPEDEKYKSKIGAIVEEIRGNRSYWEDLGINFDDEESIKKGAIQVFYYRFALTVPQEIWVKRDGNDWYDDAFIRDVQWTKLADILANTGDIVDLNKKRQVHHLKKVRLALIEFVEKTKFLIAEDKETFIQELRKKLEAVKSQEQEVREEMAKLNERLHIIDAAVKEGKASVANPAEPAMEKPGTKGGIDLNAANLDMQIKRDGSGMMLPLNQQDLDNIKIDGLVPVILKIESAGRLPLFSQLEAQAGGGSA